MKSTATLNPVMSGHAAEFMRDPMGFVGLALFPAFASAVQSSDYYVWDRENSLNIPRNLRRAPGAPFARSGMQLSDDLYACQNYGHETPVPDEHRAKYRNAINADLAAVRKNVEVIKVNHELRVKTKATSNAVPNSGVTLTWLDDDSDPKADVDIAREAIRMGIGMRPNLMVIPEAARLRLETHPLIAERVKYTTTGVTSLQILAGYFGVPRIIVAEQIENTANEGQTVTAADIWGEDVLLAYVDGGQDLMRPSFGRTFYWAEFGTPGADDVPIMIESYRDESVKSDIHRSLHHTDEKLTCPLAGYRLTGALDAVGG